jgi:parvulin-like peptidyl-prolyl isomerase
MKPFKILIPFFALFSLSVPHIAYAVPDSVTQMGYHPVAVVNDVAITPYDIEKRIKLIRFLNDIPVTVTLSNSDKNALLKTITDEIIKAQEVTRFKADPKPERVNDYLKDLARQKNMTLDAFLKQLDSIGITRTEAEKIFSRQIAWRDLLQGRYGRDINVSTYEISQIIEASLKTGNLQFAFDSIIIPFDNQAELKDKQSEAESILNRLKTGENFDVIKSAYSTDIKQPESLIPLAQIDESLHSFLLQSDIGQISGLIRTKNGFEIIRLNNRQSDENTGLMIKKSFKTGLLSKEDKTETILKSVLNKAFADKNICTDFDDYFIKTFGLSLIHI